MADEPTVVEQKKAVELLKKISATEERALEKQEAWHGEVEVKDKKERADKGKTHKRAEKQLKDQEKQTEEVSGLAKTQEKLVKGNEEESKKTEKDNKIKDEKTDAQIEYEELKKKRSEKDSKKRDDKKVDEMRHYNRLEELGWQNEDDMDDMAKQMADGLVLSEAELIEIGKNKDAIAEQTLKDERAEARKKAKDDALLVKNQNQEDYLKGLFTLGDWNKDFAERQAKRVMQMKESVGKWWQDKKDSLKKTGMGLLDLLMKGAGLYILYELFTWLAKQDLKKLYETSKEALASFWGGMTALGAWWLMIGARLKKTKFGLWIAKGIKAIRTFFGGTGAIWKILVGMMKFFGHDSVMGKMAFKVLQFVEKIKKMFQPIIKAFGFVKKVSGLGKIMKFLKTIMKVFGKLFLPISLLMGAWAAISGGLDEAAEESGGFPQKILSFISGALKGLLDFFIFDLAALIQDGIKWAIGWFMGLFGFNEEEIEKATDFDFVKPIKDAVFKAIDWLRDLFRFEDTSLKGIFSSLIDIVTAPLGMVITFVKNIFGWGDPDEPFSLGKLITDTVDSIWQWLKDFLNPKKLLEKLNPLNWFGGDDSKEDIQKEIAELQADNAVLNTGTLSGRKRKESNLKKMEELEEKLAKMETGGSILPGGMAIVGEGSMSGELVMNTNSAAKVIPAKESADIMSGMGGGGEMFAPTTIVNSAPSATTMIAGSNSLNPISQKYFRSD